MKMIVLIVQWKPTLNETACNSVLSPFHLILEKDNKSPQNGHKAKQAHNSSCKDMCSSCIYISYLSILLRYFAFCVPRPKVQTYWNRRVTVTCWQLNSVRAIPYASKHLVLKCLQCANNLNFLLLQTWKEFKNRNWDRSITDMHNH